MWSSSRSALLTVAVVAVAVVIFAFLFTKKVNNARQDCIDRGGQVVIVSDPLSIAQYCVFPSGSREPI
jgi:hypothetical protein